MVMLGLDARTRRSQRHRVRTTSHEGVAANGPRALVAGRGSRGDACVVAQEKKPDVWSCPTDCAAVAAPSAQRCTQASMCRRVPRKDKMAASRGSHADRLLHGLLLGRRAHPLLLVVGDGARSAGDGKEARLVAFGD